MQLKWKSPKILRLSLLLCLDLVDTPKRSKWSEALGLGFWTLSSGPQLELDPKRALTVIMVASLWGPDMLASKILLRGCILNKIRERRNVETQHFRLRFWPGRKSGAAKRPAQWFKSVNVSNQLIL